MIYELLELLTTALSAWQSWWYLPLIAYLLGSIPFGLLFARWFSGVDIRQHGSGNIGATNALRTGGKTLGIATLLADIAKGSLAVWLAINQQTFDVVIAISFVAVVCGHVFPIWLKFKGGKGVATVLGALLPWLPLTALAAALLFALVCWRSRIVSAASIAAAISLPLFAELFYGVIPAIACILCGVLVIARHHENIIRLLNGSEAKLGSGSKLE
ncbi:MAG: glycerol-3-phosphate 1-O-acyltransferase PlsY [Mariprofundales bacterium]